MSPRRSEGTGKKSPTTLHLKLEESFEREALDAKNSGPMQDLPFTSFLLVLMRYGLDEYQREQRESAKRHSGDESKDDEETDGVGAL